MLFSDQRRHSLALPSEDKDGRASNIAFLIDHLCQHLMRDTRKELFVLDGHLYVPCSWLQAPGPWLPHVAMQIVNDWTTINDASLLPYI